MSSVSVFIPVKNEAVKIRACLDGILSQTVPVDRIIVVDSGSTDGTLDILAEYPKVHLVEIPGFEFNHGTTRNLGPQHTDSEFILYTVGDSRPIDEYWIERMIQPLQDDPSIDAVCGSQVVPHERDKNPVEWFRPQSEPQVSTWQFNSWESFERLDPSVKRAVIGWDDVSALYRRSALEKVPFEAVTYGEDIEWVHNAIRAGLKFAYNPAARVYHYHLVTREFTIKQVIATLYHRYRLFGLLPTHPDRFESTIRSLKLILRASGLSISERFRWFRYNIDQSLAIKEAIEEFDRARIQGETALAEAYERICGKPPIPIKG